MSVVLLLLIASLIIAAGFLAAFIWSVRNGQYDDDYTPSVRMLFEEKPTQNQPLNHDNKPDGTATPSHS
jgi:cbb3-type cytochrome oxidase maturation protein